MAKQTHSASFAGASYREAMLLGWRFESMLLLPICEAKIGNYFHGFYGKTEFLHELLEFGVTVSCNPKMLERLEFFDFLKKNPEYFDRIKLETDDSNFDISCLYTKFYEGMNK